MTAVAFDLTGHLLAAGVYDVGEEDGAIRLGRALAVWHAGCGTGAAPLSSYQLPFDGNEAVTAIDWSGHGNRFAVGSENGAIWTGSSPDAPERFGSPIRALGHSPDGRRLLAFVGNILAVWDFARPEWYFPWQDEPRILDAAYSPDGQMLAVTRRDGTVTLHDADTLAPRRTYDWKLGPLHSVAFAPDGLTCAAGATRRRVVTWDLE